MCVYVYVCVYVRMCVCMCVFACVCVHVYMYVFVCTYNYFVSYHKFSYVIKVCICYFIQARDTLSAENADLCEQLREAKIKIHALQQHLEVIRSHTIGFILEQMNTPHIEN